MKKLLFALAGVAATVGIVKHNKKAIMRCIGKQFTPERKAKMMVNHLGEKLNLTYAQKDQLQPLFEECVTKMHGKSESAEALFTSFKEGFTSETFDAEALSEELKDTLIAEKVSHMTGVISELHAILTKSQREKLVTIMEEKGKHFSCCHNGMGHGLRNSCS